jgi:hypothetical protein
MVRNSIRDNGMPQCFVDLAGQPNTSPELTQFVTAAIGEYSRYRALRRPYTINVVTGTAMYTLPADWIGVDQQSFERAVRPRRDDGWGDAWEDDFMLTYESPVFIDGSLSVSPQRLRYQWYDDLQQLVLSAAPLTDYSLTFDYWATHSDGTDSAVTVPRRFLDVALAPACELALRAIATDQAMKLQLYRMANGKLEVDNRTIKDALLKQAEDWRERFRKEVVLRPVASIG